jgi:hypothetical protein
MIVSTHIIKREKLLVLLPMVIEGMSAAVMLA